MKRTLARLAAAVLSCWPTWLDGLWDSARATAADLFFFAEYGRGRHAQGAVFYRAP